jgi:hypothetical protein
MAEQGPAGITGYPGAAAPQVNDGYFPTSSPALLVKFAATIDVVGIPYR